MVPWGGKRSIASPSPSRASSTRPSTFTHPSYGSGLQSGRGTGCGSWVIGVTVALAPFFDVPGSECRQEHQGAADGGPSSTSPLGPSRRSAHPVGAGAAAWTRSNQAAAPAWTAFWYTVVSRTPTQQ